MMVSAAIAQAPTSDIAIVHTSFDHMVYFIFVFLPKARYSKGDLWRFDPIWELLAVLHHALQVLQPSLIDAIEESGQGTF
ncbi:MAG: hypothetical protein ACJ8G2_00885, partial [Burkholderiales bacterium]